MEEEYEMKVMVKVRTKQIYTYINLFGFCRLKLVTSLWVEKKGKTRFEHKLPFLLGPGSHFAVFFARLTFYIFPNKVDWDARVTQFAEGNLNVERLAKYKSRGDPFCPYIYFNIKFNSIYKDYFIILTLE